MMHGAKGSAQDPISREIGGRAGGEQSKKEGNREEEKEIIFQQNLG